MPLAHAGWVGACPWDRVAKVLAAAGGNRAGSGRGAAVYLGPQNVFPCPVLEMGCPAPIDHCVHASNKPLRKVLGRGLDNHSATTQATSSWGWGMAIGQQRRGFGGQTGCPKPEHPKPEHAAACAHSLWAGAASVYSPPSLVQGGSVLALPWGWDQLGNLCALEQGARRAGGFCQLRAPQLISLQQGQWHQSAQR